ncbi:MAG: amidase [Chloroflexi bacterium]|nr:MAG: amidase [Chloroflexota bacterium]
MGALLAFGTPRTGAQALARHPVARATIKNYAFHPMTLTIAAGSTVTWTNMDPDNHTVTTDPGSGVHFGSSTLAGHSVFKHTFNKPGVYRYHCSFHPFMNGVIRVKKRAT